LASLRAHEKRQARQQAEAARARAEAEQLARAEAERAAAHNERERRLAERAALTHIECVPRAEFAELETAQRSEFERAEALLRSEAELKLQLGREREARQGLELRVTSQLLRQRLWASASAALCVSGGLAAALLYFGALRPGAERALATAQQSLLDERRARVESQEREAHSRRRADELSSRVNALERDLRAEREPPVAAQPGLGSGRKRTTRQQLSLPPPAKPCRDDGDPLNPCLKR